MGIWSDSYYGNDDALDFLEDLPKKGLRRWEFALRKGIQNGLKRVRSTMSDEEIEEKLAVMLKQHEVHLLAGRMVGSRQEYERRWRQVFEKETKDKYLAELLEYACAVDLLACFTVSNVPIDVPEEVTSWLKRNNSRIRNKVPELVELCLSSWVELSMSPGVFQPVMVNFQDSEAWFAGLEARIEIVRRAKV